MTRKCELLKLGGSFLEARQLVKEMYIKRSEEHKPTAHKVTATTPVYISSKNWLTEIHHVNVTLPYSDAVSITLLNCGSRSTKISFIWLSVKSGVGCVLAVMIVIL